jgi:hypothetical protein
VSITEPRGNDTLTRQEATGVQCVDGWNRKAAVGLFTSDCTRSTETVSSALMAMRDGTQETGIARIRGPAGWNRLDQVGSGLSRLDQVGSGWSRLDRV